MKKKQWIISLSVLIALLLITALAAGLVYRKISSPALDASRAQEYTLYIDDQTDFESIVTLLEDRFALKDAALFRRIAKRMNYPEYIKPGRYVLSPESDYIELVRLLRSGAQAPLKLTFNNIRTKTDLANRLAEQLMFPSDSLLVRLNDSIVCASYGLDTLTIQTLFIPNTYEVYWTITPDALLDRMKSEYDRFWTEGRKAKAAAVRLTPTEVSTLASIVEEETALQSEYPIVAGLYLNRLKKGMLLQADPTVKFAVGDVALRRILYKHLEADSPYNTYKYAGLPPGPIRLPSIAGVDAVLNQAKHNYLYMCAKEDFSGAHNFAVTLAEHNRNARRYQDALNRAGIR